MSERSSWHISPKGNPSATSPKGNPSATRFRPALLPRAIIDVNANGLAVKPQSVQLFHRLLHPSAGRKIDVARLVAALPAPVLGQPQVPFSMHEVGDFSPFDRGRQIVDDEAILVRFSFIRRRLPAL